jgi:membrane associated rhomboid family serine protease
MLLIANGAVFLFQMLLGIFMQINNMGSPDWFIYYFALIPELVVESGFVWQLITYQFLHGGFFHILINMFILWMFGVELERAWGAISFLRFYLLCGVAAGVSMVLFNYGPMPTVGASGAILGLLGAYATYWPERDVYLWGIIPMKVKHFVLMIGIISLLAGISETNAGIAHMAHLGGLLMGLFYCRFGNPQNPLLGPVSRWLGRRKTNKKRKEWEETQKKRDDLMEEADNILDRMQNKTWENVTDSDKERIQEISEELKDFLNNQ